MDGTVTIASSARRPARRQARPDAADPAAEFHPEWLEHAGTRILRLDFSGLWAERLVEAMDQARPVIASQPLRSIRLLTIWKARLTEETAGAVKQFAAHNTPFVLASAVVGATAFQSTMLVLTIKSQGREHLEIHDDEEKAKDWLARF